MSNDHVHPLFAALLSDVREATQTLANCAALGKLQKDGTRMAYIRTRDDDDPEYRTSEEEMAAEIADQARVIADLDEALTKIADIAGDYGDGAPDDHYLAHILLQLESIATSALDEARGPHRKALEAMQKRQP
jgi:hypothetical protein